MNSDNALHIVFVCTGNTCRSPMAEAIARRIIAEKGLPRVTAGSAGTDAWPGDVASTGARVAATSAGLDLDRHRSRRLDEDVVGAARLLACMSEYHVHRVEALGAHGKAHLLTELAGEWGDVADPFGGPDSHYQATFEQLERLVEAALSTIAACEGA